MSESKNEYKPLPNKNRSQWQCMEPRKRYPTSLHNPEIFYFLKKNFNSFSKETGIFFGFLRLTILNTANHQSIP
jgi:hypothetical protein